MKNKKNGGKIFCLTLILSLLMGFGGCAMLLQNVKQEAARQEQEKQENPDVQEGDSTHTMSGHHE